MLDFAEFGGKMFLIVEGESGLPARTAADAAY
jgi:hypothetical protein